MAAGGQRSRTQRTLAGRAWACLALLGMLAPLAHGQWIPLEAGTGWTTRAQGSWTSRWDHRDLLAMRHPWQPSENGGFVQLSRLVQVPADWTGPVSLSFYCSDDYHTDRRQPDGSWLTAEGFVGHRFKQVLADGAMVWNQDVADPVLRDPMSVSYLVPLPVKPGQTFLLSLLAYDAEASGTRLAEDFYQPGDSGRTRDSDPDADRFQTHVYWGDVAIVNGNTTVPRGKRPVERRVSEVHARRWPLPPFGDGWKSNTVTLNIDWPQESGEVGFPVRQGIPFPSGMLLEVDDVRLQTASGTPIAAQKAVTGRWPDGSIRWLSMDAILKPETGQAVLAFKKDRAAAPSPFNIEAEDVQTRLRREGLALGVGGDALLSAIAGKTPAVERVDLELVSGGDQAAITVDSAEVLVQGPIRTTLVIRGRLESVERRLASCTIYLDAFARLPYLRLWIRVFNDTNENLPVGSMPVTLDLPQAPEAWQTPYGDVTGDLEIVQINEQERTQNDNAVDAARPIFVGWRNGAAVIRQFRELFPKAITAHERTLTIDLVHAASNPVVFTPGEAVSHELWLTLDAETAPQLAQLVYWPPVLSNPDYYCATGVLGPAATHKGADALRQQMTKTYAGRNWLELGQSMGLRHFPDSPYMGGLPLWSNDYYGRMLNLWSEWFMSGDRAWYDRAMDVCRHIMDVAVVHSEVPGKDWLGAIHGPGDNHVAGPWAPTLRTAGLALYRQLAADPDAEAACLAAADFCVRTGFGMDGESVRQHAGPFDTICAAYWDGGDVSYLDDGTKRVGQVWANIDRRRGVWPDAHGSRVYRGNVPWMAAQLARPLYWWYEMTGDLEAAQALVALAESILCENVDWDHPGVMAGYSHNPRFPVTARYDLMILPMVLAAYELTEDTFFLDAAKAQWERWLRSGEFDSVFNVYWNTPWLMWQAGKYGLPLALAPDSGQTDALPGGG